MTPLPSPRPGPLADPTAGAAGPGPWAVAGRLRGDAATAGLARGLAARLRPGDTVLLSGPVGAGKSALARAVIRARLGDPAAEVPSPSFTLVQTYGEDGGDGTGEIWHADLQRLGGPAEVAELGLAEAMGRALLLIEWPDRLGPLAPADALRIGLDHVADPEARAVTLAGSAAWGPRLAGLLSGSLA